MILRERTRVHATPEQIWTVIGDPRRMCSWNSHCVRCDASEDTMRVGLRFKALMRFSQGPERQLDCEVLECEPDRILSLRFSGEASFRTGEYVKETYVLQPVGRRTKILHQIDFSHSGLPWLAQAMLKVIGLVRHHKDLSLEGLQGLFEQSKG